MEHLWVNNMVTTEGELSKLGRFAADMEPNDPENGALLWYGHQFNVLREATIIYKLPLWADLSFLKKDQAKLL